MARRLEFDNYDMDGFDDEAKEFGFMPASLMAELDTQQDYRTRMPAMEQVQKLLMDCNEELLLPHLSKFVKFLTSLLNDKNFTILLTTLQVVGDLIKKVGRNMNPHLRIILPRLIAKFGDNKIVIRQMNMKLFNIMLQALTPAPIMNMLMSSTPHENWHVRKQVVNCITVSLLSYPKYGFEYMRLVRTLGCVLNDPKAKVRNGSFDALAVVHRNIGDRLFDLVEEINEEEEATNGVLLITQTQLSMLRKRLTEGYMLPVAREDGSVESSYTYEDDSGYAAGFASPPSINRHPSTSSGSSKRIPFPISLPNNNTDPSPAELFGNGRSTPSRRQGSARNRKPPSEGYAHNYGQYASSGPTSAPIQASEQSFRSQFGESGDGSQTHRSFGKTTSNDNISHGYSPQPLIPQQHNNFSADEKKQFPSFSQNSSNHQSSRQSSARVQRSPRSPNRTPDNQYSWGDNAPPSLSPSPLTDHAPSTAERRSPEFEPSPPGPKKKESNYRPPTSEREARGFARPASGQRPASGPKKRVSFSSSIAAQPKESETVMEDQHSSQPPYSARDEQYNGSGEFYENSNGEDFTDGHHDGHSNEKIKLWLAVDDVHSNQPRRREPDSERGYSSHGSGHEQASSGGRSRLESYENDNGEGRYPASMNSYDVEQAALAHLRALGPGSDDLRDADRPATERAHIVSKLKSLKLKRTTIEAPMGPNRVGSAHINGRRRNRDEYSRVEERQNTRSEGRARMHSNPGGYSSSRDNHKYSRDSQRRDVFGRDRESFDSGHRSNRRGGGSSNSSFNADYGLSIRGDQVRRHVPHSSARRDDHNRVSKRDSRRYEDDGHRSPSSNRGGREQYSSLMEYDRGPDRVKRRNSRDDSRDRGGRDDYRDYDRRRRDRREERSYDRNIFDTNDEYAEYDSKSSQLVEDDPVARSPEEDEEDEEHGEAADWVPPSSNKKRPLVRRSPPLHKRVISSSHGKDRDTFKERRPSIEDRRQTNTSPLVSKRGLVVKGNTPTEKPFPERPVSKAKAREDRPLPSSRNAKDERELPSSYINEQDFEQNEQPDEELADDEIFVPSANLTPVNDPSRELKQCVKRLQSKNWKERFIGLTNIRRLSLYHPNSLTNKTQHFVKELRKEVDSLRSGIVKNAVTCCNDLFENLGKGMDNEAAILAPVLLKRACDANVFLAREAGRALMSMITSCSSNKVLAILLSCASSDSKSAIQSISAEFIDRYIENEGPVITQNRDYRRLLRCVGGFVVGTSSQMRDWGKMSVAKLCHFSGSFEFEKLCKTVLPANQYTAVKKLLDRGISIGYMPPSTSHGPRASSMNSPYGKVSSRGRVSSASMSVRGQSSRSVSYGGDEASDSSSTFDNLQRRTPSSGRERATSSRRRKANVEMDGKLAKIRGDMSSSDWSKRTAALGDLLKFTEQNQTAANDLVLEICTALSERLNDNNKKVNMQALRTTKKMIPLLTDSLGSVLNSLLPALAGNLAATNAAVKVITGDCLDIMDRSVDAKLLCPAYCNAAIFGNPRCKVVMLEKITRVVRGVYRENPRIVSKHVVSLVFQLLGESKTDIRKANTALAKEVYACMGSSLFDPQLTNRLTPQALDKLKVTLGAK